MAAIVLLCGPTKRARGARSAACTWLSTLVFAGGTGKGAAVARLLDTKTPNGASR